MNATGTELMQYLRKLAAGRTNDAYTDQQLLEQFVMQREQASFAALLRRHGPMVLGVCRRVLRHDQDAEDAFQATFLVLARKAGSIRKHESIGSWLHGVAYHVAEKLRAKKVQRMVHERKAPSRPVIDPAQDVAWSEIRCLLDSELSRLPDCYRGPLVLCYLQGRTQDEAARQLEWSLSTLRRRLNRARGLLAHRLRRRGVTLSAALSAPLLADATAQASLPPLLAATTVRAGLASALGNTVNDIVLAQVVALAESSVGSLLAKKTSIALVLLASLTLGLGGLLTHREVQSRTLAEALSAPKFAAPESPPPQPAHIISKEKTIEIKGHVLDPDGKPFAGARLFLLSAAPQKKTDKPVRATTDKDGRFRFQAKPPDFDADGKATLAAVAKGLGPDWIEVTMQNKDALTLHLAKDDVPVIGRVLDLEGRPVAGVRVRVAVMMQGDVDAWIEGTLRNRNPQLQKRISPEALSEAVQAVTGKDGRFRLTGLGRDRVMRVQLEGDNIERGSFEVVTRPELPKGLRKGNDGVYPARFDHLAGPAKTIAGTVRDKRTGKPIAGISVACPVRVWVGATTDAQGRYRLTGLPKQTQYWVAAAGIPYFNCTKRDVVDTPGLESIAVDFALERGIAVRGRLIDKATGKPVRGRVGYLSLPDNPNRKDFTDLGKPQYLAIDSGKTKADGSFTVIAVPGPGFLTATAHDHLRYLRADVELPKSLEGNIPRQYHTLVRIAPSEEDAQSAVRDIALEPARTRKGTVTDSDGKSLVGAHFAGLSGVVQLRFGRNDALETASFTVGGLAPKGSRNLVFVHAEKQLAKVQKVRGADEGPLTVRLEPFGALAGRILDDRGQPRTKLKVSVMLSVSREDYENLPLELLYDYPAWGKILNREATTDAEGRFRVEGLVPGLKYLINVKEDGAILESLTREIAVESGKTKDLGDLKNKLAPGKGSKEKP